MKNGCLQTNLYFKNKRISQVIKYQKARSLFQHGGWLLVGNMAPDGVSTSILGAD